MQEKNPKNKPPQLLIILEFFVFILRVFHIMHLDSIHFLALRIHPLPLQVPPNKIKFKREKGEKEDFCYETCNVTQCVTQ